MAKIKSGIESDMTRNEFNKIKTMDRREIETYRQGIYSDGYSKGYEQGCKDTKEKLKKECMIMPTIHDTYSKEEFVAFLSTVSGVGVAIRSKIEKALVQWDSSSMKR